MFEIAGAIVIAFVVLALLSAVFRNAGSIFMVVGGLFCVALLAAALYAQLA